MKRTKINNPSWSVLAAGVMTSLLLAMSASAQYSRPGGSITIPDFPGLPTAYPSKITVNSDQVKGTLERVTVTLNTVTHSYANDIAVMLEAPDGKAVVLMSDSGGGQPVGGVSLTFADSGSTLPRFSAITSGTYKPSNPGGVTFPSAPAPTGTDMAHLAASTPVGDWKLYVIDTSSFNAGSIGSWTLNLYTTPVLTATNTAIQVAENSTTNAFFTVRDDSTPVDTLKFTAVSDNTTLIPNANIKIGSSGTTRSIQVTPASLISQDQIVHITVTAEDELGGKGTLAFTVTVKDVNQRPTISVNTNNIIVNAGSVSSNLIVFLEDLDFPNPSSLVINVTSSDNSIVAPAGVIVGSTPPYARPVAIVPSTTSGGSTALTFTVTDGTDTSTPVLVNVTVLPIAQPLYANTTALSPSTTSSSITVPTLSGNIGRIEVSLKGLKNFVPQGATVTITKGSKTATLLPASAVSGPVTYAQMTFANTGVTTLPSTDFIGNLFVSASDLAQFAGDNPSGQWTLTIGNGGANFQAGAGWQLKIFSAPTISAIPELAFTEDSSGTVSFGVADLDGSVTNVTVDPADIAALATVGGTNVSGNTATITLIGKSNAFGTNTAVTVTAKDNHGFTVTRDFTLRVIAVNDAPDISFIPKQVTFAGRPLGPINFTITDVDNPSTDLTLTASSSNIKILPLQNIFLQRTGQNVAMTLFPLGATAGESFVTLTTSDGQLSDSSSFTFYVQGPGNPLYLSPIPITVNAGSVATPYPGTNYVTNLVGAVAEVQVTLQDFTSIEPQNLNILLQGPNGNSVVLMANAGGDSANDEDTGDNVTNATIVFGDAAAANVPATSLRSGMFKPTLLGTVSFPTPAPATPTHATLAAAFNGSNPNGTWKLYAYDDATGKSLTTIAGSWMLSIRTAPAITDIPDTEMDENTPKCIDVTVGDDQPGVPLTITAVAAPATPANLIQGIGIIGSGATRKICFTNTPYLYGAATITVTATDPELNVNDIEQFTLNVKRVDLPPVVTKPDDQTTPAAVTVGPISFKAWSPQFDLTTTPMKIDITSDNPTLVPNANISPATIQSTDQNTNTYTFTILPAGIQTGTANITITVTDGVNQKTSVTFKLTVTASLVYAFEKPINIPMGLPVDGVAQPYPAVIPVSGLEGAVKNVRVALVGFSHTFPDDVSVLLVSPNNDKAVLLMQHAGGSADAQNARLTFSASASGPLPDGGPIVTGTYQPGVYTAAGQPAISLPAPAPQISYTTLGGLEGLDPNGDWKVYVLDDSFPDQGSISGGVLLYIDTKPSFKNIGQQTTPENVPAYIPLTIFNSTVNPSNLVLTAVASATDKADPADVTSLNAKFAFEGFGGNRAIWITNAADQPSKGTFVHAQDKFRNMTNTITVRASVDLNGDGTPDPGGVYGETSFVLVATYANQPPRITGNPGNITMAENSEQVVTWTVADPDSNITNDPPRYVVVYPSNTTLFGKDSVTLNSFTSTDQPTALAISAKLKPSANQFGKSDIIFAVQDYKQGAWTTNVITVTVPNTWDPPTITPQNIAVTGTNVTAGQSKTYAIKVGSTEVPVGNLIMWAESSSGIIPNAYVTTGGSGADRTLTVRAIGEDAGASVITVWVTDLTKTSSVPITVTVNADSAKGLWVNSTPLAVTGAEGRPSDYPSIITIPVGQFNGKITKVTATLDGLRHTEPASLDVLLVGPDNATAVILMSGAGDAIPVTSPVILTFDDTGDPLPTGQLTSGKYHPGTVGTKPVLPDTPEKYEVNLSAFNGKDATGQWRLYVYNRGGSGSILGGWRLTINTGPTIIVNSSNLTVDENSPANPTQGTIDITVGDDFSTESKKLVVTATSSNPVLLPVRNINVGGTDNYGRTVRLTPEFYQSGESKVVLTVTKDGGPTASTAELLFKVNPKNTPPVTSRLNDITMYANEQTTTLFLVTDGDTPLDRINIKAESSNQAIIKDSKLLFFGKSNPTTNGLPSSATPLTSIVSLTIDPEDDAQGVAQITLTITDPDSVLGNNTVTRQFFVTVNKFDFPPQISDIQPQFVVSGGTTPDVPFTVTSPVQNTFTVTGSSSDTTLVPNANVTVTHVSGNNYTVRATALNVVPGPESKKTVITVRAEDPVTHAFSLKSFDLTVLPPRERTYTNSAPITISDASAANPYPSTIKVSDLLGKVSQVTVTLRGFTHTFPSDVGVLLVGPTGQKLVLMNRAGQGGADVFGAWIKFDQSAASAIPSSGILASPGQSVSYKPADYRSGSYNFPPPAPEGSYSTNTLDAFNGLEANGTWSLYVYDDALGDVGAITNGWSLGLTTQPLIIGLTNVYMLEDAVHTQPFTVADDSRFAPAYTFIKTSSKTDIIPLNNITITQVGSSGRDFNVTVDPISFGSNVVIGITAQNNDGQSVTKSFTVDVGYKATPPTIADIPDASMAAGSVLTVPVNYNDAHTPKDQLVRTVTSSDTTLIPDTSIKWTGTNLVISPVGSLTGTATITVTVKNKDDLSASDSFVLTVNPVPGLYANSGKITINDATKATPYPSTIEVAGLAGAITDVNVTLAGLQHSFPQDISILLVSPQGQKIVLMSRAAGSAPINNVRLTFDDEAAVVLPQTGTITDGNYRPGDYKASDSYASPAPVGPYDNTLSVLDNYNPNGTWSLYVQDEASQDAGAINQGWSLNITTTLGAKSVAAVVGGPSLALGKGANGLTLSINGTPNVDYTIQSSTDLNNWSDAGSVTADDNGKAELDIENSGAPAQFYRALPK